MVLMEEEQVPIHDHVAVHVPISYEMVGDIVLEDEKEDENMPELMDNIHEDSDDEADDDDDVETAKFLGDGEENALAELYEILEEASTENDSDTTDKVHQPPVRRSTRTNAGVKHRDDRYDWNFMNLSPTAAIKEFGDNATKACKQELQHYL